MGWTVCHKSSTTAPILNLCRMTRYQLKGSVFLCPPTTTRRSPTMSGSSSSSSSSFFLSRTPLTGPRLTLGSVLPSSCLEEVIESATLNPLCFPNSYLSELQPEAAVPDFHWRGLVGQFATGRQHLPQF